MKKKLVKIKFPKRTNFKALPFDSQPPAHQLYTLNMFCFCAISFCSAKPKRKKLHDDDDTILHLILISFNWTFILLVYCYEMYEFLWISSRLKINVHFFLSLSDEGIFLMRI